MFYYQILKKRRLDLNLSVQDISIQTHLAPEFIRAIEDNNLDVFAQDLSYVRYFVHSYADALGVNWRAIQPEVDGNIEVYARARDQALTEAQRLMAAQMTQAQSRTSRKKSGKSSKKKSPVRKNTASVHKSRPKRRRVSFFKASANALSRMLNWDKRDSLSKFAIVGTISAICVLAGLNYVVESASARQLAAQKEERRQELLEKEQETQRLADQLQTKKDEDAQANGTAPIVTASTKDTNTFYITNVIGVSDSLSLSVDAASPLSIKVTEQDRQLFTQQIDEGPFSRAVSVSGETTITIACTDYTSKDTFSISGTAVPLNASGFTNGAGEIVLKVVYAVPDESSKTDKKDTDTASDSQSDTSDQEAGSSDTETDSQNSTSSQNPSAVQYDAYGNPVTEPDTQTQYDAYGNPIPEDGTVQYDLYGNPVPSQSQTTPEGYDESVSGGYDDSLLTDPDSAYSDNYGGYGNGQ